LKNRLFISLNLPDEVIEKIISLRNSIVTEKNVMWEPREKLHLTLKFIGDVSDEVMSKISEELDFIPDYQSIKCSFSKFDFFYRDQKPIVLIAALQIENPIKNILVKIDERLSKFNIPIDNRKFNPHMTLLRIKNDLGFNFVNNFKKFSFKPILFNANYTVLYKSILHPEGSEYIKIKNYKLKELEK
jgi:RNA 2',3'-cyclic 3'-phosphodiesterase